MEMHRQVSISWRHLHAEVDEEMAPLILSLWMEGIVTCNSCQENMPGVAWVEFLTTRDARRFLDLVAEYPDESELRVVDGRLLVGDVPFWETLYGRVTGCGGEGDWVYDVNVHDWGVDEEVVDDEVVSTRVGPSQFEFTVSVRFPRSDLPLILERIGAARAA